MILLVDPFADERDMYAELLRFEGFDVSVCATPSVAIAKAKTANVLAVITRDRQPGHLNGIALTRLLKSHALTQSIPVIVITSHIETHIRTAAHEAGCDAFLMIPHPPDQLVAEVRRLAEASRRTTSRFIPCSERESARGAS